MRKGLLTVALLMLIAGCLSGENSTGPSKDFFPVSVWYSGGKARAPMLDPVTKDSSRLWKEDLQKIKTLGFNTVRTWVEWNVGEPREGEYHLENLDLLLRLAEEEGLKVVVQVYVDSAPEWVGVKYPEGHYAAQDGQPIPSQASPGYCFDHPQVRRAVLGFFQEIARHVKNSAAFHAWDLWSEPAALNWARLRYKSGAMFCYCPSSMERFRQWLTQKYGSLESLNTAWHRTFLEWSRVEPPRFGTILTYSDFMDWRVFYGYKLAEDLRMRHDAVKAIDPHHTTTSHAPNPSPLVRTLADPYDPTDDFLMKDSVDYYGTSLYPKLTSPENNWSLNRRVLSMDLTQAITGGRGFYVGELQSGFGIRGTIVGSEVTPSDLELWTWGMVSRGARAINYYAFYPMNAGYESGGYGMINLDGTLTERSRRAGQTAQLIASNTAWLLQSKPQPAEAAIVFSPLVPLLGGYDEENSRNSIHQSVAGYHRMFFERNLPLEVLSSRELATIPLQRYKLILLPFALMMTADQAGALQQYVKEGGHLFVEARPGWVNEHGFAEPLVPGFGWDKLLGVREKSLDPGKEFPVRWGTEEFTCIRLREHLEPLDPETRSVATFSSGSPAAFEHRYGKGSTLILGSFAGQANEQKPVAQHPLGGILAHWAGLTIADFKAPALVELRQMISPEGRFFLFFNHGERAADVFFNTQLDKPAAHIREIVTGQSIPPEGQRFQVTTEIPAEAVRVYRIDF